MENNRWLRENARDELITEKIVNAISDIDPIIVPDYLSGVNNSKSAILAFTDCHFGIEFLHKRSIWQCDKRIFSRDI